MSFEQDSQLQAQQTGTEVDTDLDPTQIAAEQTPQDVSLVVLESQDFQHYISSTNDQVKETLTIYEQIAAQHAKEGSQNLTQIAQVLMQKVLESGQELHTQERVEASGLITVKLAHNTPLTRLQRALTLASYMSGEAIPPALVLIDNVTTIAATTLVQAQEAIKQAKQNSSKYKRRARNRNKKAKVAQPKVISPTAVSEAVSAALDPEKKA